MSRTECRPGRGESKKFAQAIIAVTMNGPVGCKDKPGPSFGTPAPERNGRFASPRNHHFLFSIQEITVTGQSELRIVCSLLNYPVQALRYKGKRIWERNRDRLTNEKPLDATKYIQPS